MPRDGDLNPMEMAAVAMHELYESLKKGGFSRSEALTVIAKLAAEMMAAQQGENSDPDKT